ncbi:MAG: hypothetical protein WBB29_05475 [Geitlerinemataceae cyanobacterium]
MIANLPVHSQLGIAQDLKIRRIFNGMWQMSGACRPIDVQKAIAVRSDDEDAGCPPLHLADSDRRQRLQVRGEEALSQLPALTQWFPRLIPIMKTLVQCLDFLQFHQSSIERQISIQLLVMVAKSLDCSLEGSAQKLEESVQTKRAV